MVCACACAGQEGGNDCGRALYSVYSMTALELTAGEPFILCTA